MKIQTIDGKGNGAMAVHVIFTVVCFAGTVFIFAICDRTRHVLDRRKERKQNISDAAPWVLSPFAF
jgi:hypothetical protein